jgi:RES domain-containing protein
MFIWRLTNQRNADLSGRGGELADGRWHTRGRPIVYCAGTASLAVLEVRVHLDLSVTPTDYVLLQITAPETVSRRVLEPADLPVGWRDPGGGHLCRPIGDFWLQERSSALLIVPSAILELEQNILLNPLHPDARGIAVSRIIPFTWDDRLLQSVATESVAAVGPGSTGHRRLGQGWRR